MAFEFLFGGNKEAKMIEASEKRQMDFQERQNSVAIGSAQDHTEIINQEGKSDLIRWQQELDDEMKKLAYQLTGWIEVEGEWIKDPNKKQLCNDRFMNDVVIPQCTPFLSRNFINSNIDEDRALNILLYTMGSIVNNMADYYDRYDIDFMNNDIIVELLINYVQPSVFRAVEGFTKKTDSTNFKRLETSMDRGMEEKKKSIFGFN